MSWKDKMTAKDKKAINKILGSKKFIKKYKLVYNDNEVLIKGVVYPICVAKRNKLINTGTYTNQQRLLVIERDWDSK